MMKMTPEEESKSCCPDLVTPNPKLQKCDICGKKGPVRWWGNTSVAICNRKECSKICNDRWKESMEESMKELKDKYNEY